MNPQGKSWDESSENRSYAYEWEISEDVLLSSHEFIYILQEAISDKSLVDQNLTKAYRLGKQPSPGRNRTIKIHTKCEDFCHSILQNSRDLSISKYYSNILVQSDLTPLQRHHLKSLVHKKRERNLRAIQCNEEPNWVIKNGRISRVILCSAHLLRLPAHQQYSFHVWLHSDIPT